VSGNGLRSERTGGIPVRECGPFGAVGLHLPSPKLRSASRKENKPRPHVGGATERGSSLPEAARLGPSGGSLPEAVQAVDRPRTVGLEGHLGLFAAVCANDVVHLPRPAVEPSAAAAASVSVSIHCSNSLFAGPSRDRRRRNEARPIRRRVLSRGRAMPSSRERPHPFSLLLQPSHLHWQALCTAARTTRHCRFSVAILWWRLGFVEA